MLRTVLADNASAMTLDGTRVYLVGRSELAIIDPGPDTPENLAALEEAVGEARVVAVLVTHAHPDHDAAAEPLAARLGAPVRASRRDNLDDGDRIPTDAGELVAIRTPGHAPDHVAFHWPAARAIFCGDLMMGGLDTALVAAPEGRIADYLASLDRIRSLRPAIIYPTHGEPFTEPAGAIGRYQAHRRDRELQVLQALANGARGLDGLIEDVYGAKLHPELRRFTQATVQAYLEHLEEQQLVERKGREWRRRA